MIQASFIIRCSEILKNQPSFCCKLIENKLKQEEKDVSN
jgi:hypothetical protein